MKAPWNFPNGGPTWPQVIGIVLAVAAALVLAVLGVLWILDAWSSR